jgi:hypothetical protein
MIRDKAVAKRLAFIRFLFNRAVEESKKSEPWCSICLLTFHDAIELFFVLSCEHLGVTGAKERTPFDDYWNLIAGGLKEKRLSQEASIKRLNKGRIAMKHQGILPLKSDVENYRVNATNFLEENTRIVFNTEIEDVSLTELVQYENAKEYLKEAERALKEGKREDALDNVACGFGELIRDYESTKVGESGRSPLSFGKDMTSFDNFFWDWGNLPTGGRFKSRMQDFVDRVTESLESLESAVRILSLGIDYRRYIKFRRLTPVVSLRGKGKWYINRGTEGSKGIATEEDVQFCIDFVIESAISIQELDFALESTR